MLTSLSSHSLPALQGLRTRDDADLSVALCDALAVMADTLTFYQERIANEAYLRTAVEEKSIHELAALIGYHPAPGVAASTHLAFKIEDAPGAPDQAPRVVTIPAGTRVQSVPASDEKPVPFETSNTITARPEWNALRPRLTKAYPPVKDRFEVVLAGVGHNLKEGDWMLFVGQERRDDKNSRKWVTRVLKTVNPQPEADRTVVTWDEPIGDVYPDPEKDVRAYVFRQRGAIFGHSAPDWSGQPDSYKASYMAMESPDQLTREDRVEWPHYDIFAPDPNLPNTYNRFVTPKPDDVVKAFDEAIKAAMLSQVKDTAGAIVGAVGSAGNAVIQPIEGIIGALGKVLKAFEFATGALNDVWTNTLKKAFEALGNLGSIGTDISNAGTTAGESFGKKVVEFFESL